MRDFFSTIEVNDVIIIPRSERMLHVCWIPPKEEWVRVNVDGAFKGNTKEARYGELVRDMHGKWLGGFTCNLGNYSVVIVEL